MRSLGHYHHVHNDSKSQSSPFIALFFPPRRASISAERQINLLNDERKASRGRASRRTICAAGAFISGDKVAAY